MISNKQKVFKKSLEIASANVYIDFGFFQKYFKQIVFKKSLETASTNAYIDFSFFGKYDFKQAKSL